MRISDWSSDVCSSDLTYYAVLTAATLAGALLAIVRLDPTDLRRPTLVSLGIIAVGAFLDTHSGLRTGPMNLYVSQAMIAFAAVYFMGPMLMEGLLRAPSKGASYLVSFVGVFRLSQPTGALAGVGISATGRVGEECDRM